MVFCRFIVINSYSKIGAQVRSNLQYLISLRHSTRSRAVTGQTFSPIFLDACATCSTLPSNILIPYSNYLCIQLNIQISKEYDNFLWLNFPGSNKFCLGKPQKSFFLVVRPLRPPGLHTLSSLVVIGTFSLAVRPYPPLSGRSTKKITFLRLPLITWFKMKGCTPKIYIFARLKVSYFFFTIGT